MPGEMMYQTGTGFEGIIYQKGAVSVRAVYVTLNLYARNIILKLHDKTKTLKLYDRAKTLKLLS